MDAQTIIRLYTGVDINLEPISKAHEPISALAHRILDAANDVKIAETDLLRLLRETRDVQQQLELQIRNNKQYPLNAECGATGIVIDRLLAVRAERIAKLKDLMASFTELDG